LGDDPQWFDRAYFVVAFVDGDKLAEGEREFSPAQEWKIAHSVVDTAAALHQVDWQARREAWGEPFSLKQELERLDHLLDRPTLAPESVIGASQLRERLRATMPASPRIGCLHGDYQWSNTLAGDDRVLIVIDWELAQIGATLIDLGWLMLFSDPSSWVVQTLVPKHIPAPEEMAEIYRSRVPWTIGDGEVRWFRAFAGYRFGVITRQARRRQLGGDCLVRAEAVRARARTDRLSIGRSYNKAQAARSLAATLANEDLSRH
jgi:aminoglycoside phosphotransferase (APT) family kinase protein